METAAATIATATPDAPAASTTETSTVPASAGASVPSDDVDLTSPEWGDIPPARRPTIAKNIREKTIASERTKWEQETRSKYGWVDGVEPSELQAFRREQAIAASMSPADYVLNLWTRVQNDPTHGPQLRSQAARILGQRAQEAPEDVMPEPDIPTDASNGRPMVYSAARMKELLEWQRRQFQAETRQALEPFQQQARTQAEREQLAAMKAESDAFASRTLDRITKLPGFKEHAQTIRDRYAALGVTDPNGNWRPDPSDPRTEGEKLRDLYAEIVLPTLTTAARQDVVADLRNKATASTVSPGAPSASRPFDYEKASWEDALKHEWSKRGGRL